jgi:hypothetical protein
MKSSDLTAVSTFRSTADARIPIEAAAQAEIARRRPRSFTARSSTVRLSVLIVVMLATSVGGQSRQGSPVVELALRQRIQLAVAAARAAVAGIDLKTVTVESASGARIDASAERVRQADHLLTTAAEFARQNPSSMSAQLILLLQLDGYLTQVDSVAVNVDAVMARASAADAKRMSAWADRLSDALDALFKVRLALETVVSEMVADGEKRLHECGK